MPPQCKSILIVDDDPLVRENLAYQLNLLGYGVYEADDGITALKMLGEEEIDALIADCDTPRLNGLNLLQAIRASESMRLLPVILVIRQLTPEKRTKAIQAGADAFLKKPLSREILEDTLDALFDYQGVEIPEYVIRESRPHPSCRIQRSRTAFRRMVRYCITPLRNLLCACVLLRVVLQTRRRIMSESALLCSVCHCPIHPLDEDSVERNGEVCHIDCTDENERADKYICHTCGRAHGTVRIVCGKNNKYKTRLHIYCFPCWDKMDHASICECVKEEEVL